jgi:ProP effector
MTTADWLKGVLETLDALRAQYPAAFGRPRPLKIKIRDDIIKRSAITEAALARALSYHCRSAPYLKAMKPGAPRIDLDGNEIGAVTSDEAVSAKMILDAPKAKKARPATGASLSVNTTEAIVVSATEATAPTPPPAPQPVTPKAPDPDEQARLARERYRRMRGLGVRV